MSSVIKSLKNIGRTRPEQEISDNLPRQLSLFPMYGQPDSHAKTFLWREWGLELGLRGQSLDSFMNLLDWLSNACPELFSSKTFMVYSVHTEAEISRLLSERWPNSGMLLDGVCLTAKTSESPNHAKESTLWDVIEKGQVQDKYFLSAGAARGMLRRTDQMGRNLFPPLRECLEILAEADQ